MQVEQRDLNFACLTDGKHCCCAQTLVSALTDRSEVTQHVPDPNVNLRHSCSPVPYWLSRQHLFSANKPQLTQTLKTDAVSHSRDKQRKLT